MAVLPFLAMCFMVSKGFIYTIAMDVYAFRCTFRGKLQRILQQIVPKKVQMAIFLNKNSFCSIPMLTLFSIKTNLRENRFFATRWAIGEQKGHS